jgi:hypothetical protein
LEISADPVSALASRPASLNPSAMSELAFDRPTAAAPLDRETLLARFDGIRQFARGGRRAPHKPLLLLYARARLKHDRQTEIRFNATEAIVNPLLRSYGPWGSGAHVAYPYGRLVNDGYGSCPIAPSSSTQGQPPPGVARERDAPAGFTPDVLATFEREPELIDVVALHLLERHFARPGYMRRSWKQLASNSAPRPRDPPSRYGIARGGARGLPCRVLRLRLLAVRCAWCTA